MARKKNTVINEITKVEDVDDFTTEDIELDPELNMCYPDENDIFIPSGGLLIDLILGGGYPLGKIVNIVGDASTGKTLICIEAIINFLNKFPNGKVFYNEAESAFNTGYAKNELGMPVEKTTFISTPTIEELYYSISSVLKKYPDNECIYIIDSLDALTDEAELKLEMTNKTFGANKAKQISRMFRQLVRKMKSGKMLLIVVSQIRDRLDITWGKPYARSGGKALTFYASQIVYLSEIGKIKKQSNKLERIVGVNIKAKAEKSKTGLPFRVCTFPIFFGYGIDSTAANLEFLESIDKIKDLSFKTKKVSLMAEQFRNMSTLTGEALEEMKKNKKEIEDLTLTSWLEIEESFATKGKKYF